ncbi:MAG: hypothetical protein IKL10_04460 [Clostridia bacterium]|nr:hypothetical protein [Clostridia bacterium]
MKKIFFFLIIIFSLFSFSSEAEAAEFRYDDIMDALSPETKSLLEDFGITGRLSEDFAEISPEKALKTVFRLFSEGLSLPLKTVGMCLALLFITTVINGFLPEKGSLSMMGKSISLMIIMFSIVSVTGEMFSRCASALLVTKDFMLVLIPVFAGIIAFSGNPTLALSFNTVAFSFAEIVTVLFQKFFPLLSSVMIAVCAAGAISPVMKLDGIGKTLSKTVNLFMAFVAGIFVAVLSVRGVIAGAADTVTIRGVRFLIGNIVPVVGSAIGEALNSIAAGMGLIKHTAGMLGIAAVIVINLPAIINVTVWKAALYFLSLSADIMENGEIKKFSENMNGVLSVIMGALCYTSFVFIISIAILITVSKG